MHLVSLTAIWLFAAPLQAATGDVATSRVVRDETVEQTIPASCLTCHAADIIESQRLSETAWLREVEKMIAWGASVDASDKELLVKSLSARFGRSASRSQSSAEPLLTRCLTCHDTRLIEEQRLTTAGWQREIDKMIAWGADLTPAEKLRLANYLAERFAPER